MTTRPLVDMVRLKTQGLSAESFEAFDLGDEVTLTIKGVIVADLEAAQAHEGTRRVQTVKVNRMVLGVSEAVHESADGQLTIEDAARDEPAEGAPGSEFAGGPAFSRAE